MHGFDWQIALTLGLLLAAALLAEGFASVVRIPKVITYLLVQHVNLPIEAAAT